MSERNKAACPEDFTAIIDALLCKEVGRSLSGSEPLAKLDYGHELRLKTEAIRKFWNAHALPCGPPGITPSPAARGYRSTSKRKASVHRGGFYLLHPGERPCPGDTVSGSLLEPESHKEIFSLLHARLSRPQDRALSECLNWIIIRKNETGLAIILNVFRVDASAVRKAKQLAERLFAQSDKVSSVFLFFDPSRSEYYLEAGAEPFQEGAAGTWRSRLRCLKGPRDLTLHIGDIKLRFPPIVFSQINQSMLPVLLDSAKELLGIKEARLSERHLLDLYCGYGLFSFGIGCHYGRVTGLELAGPAIAAARANYKRLFEGSLTRHPGMRFIEGRIRAEFISKAFNQIKTRGEMINVILDPPRRGTEKGVIEAIAGLGASRILHIFCGIDQVPIELHRWKQAGYSAERIACLDLFPGTACLEVLVALSGNSLRASLPTRLA